MAFIVEDGTGIADANAYCTVDFADAHHADLSNAAWANATTAAKQAAIIRATTFIEARYRGRWRGYKAPPHERLLSWPRYPHNMTLPPALVAIGWGEDNDEYRFAANEVPLPLRQATAEAALRSLSTELLPDLDRGGRVMSESISVGGVSQSISYAAGAPSGFSFALVDGLLSPLLLHGQAMRPLRRG